MKKVNAYIEDLLNFNAELISRNEYDNNEVAKRLIELHEKKYGPGYYKEKAELYSDISEVEDRVELAKRLVKLVGDFMDDCKKKYGLK